MKKPTLEELQKTCVATMCEHLGMVFTEIGDDFLSAKMPVDHRTKQPAGLLHGGASVALAETLGSIASALCLASDDAKGSGNAATGPKMMPVGIEINANHLKSARAGWVHGTVKPVKVGRALHIWNIEIRDDEKHLLCVSRLTVMAVPAQR